MSYQVLARKWRPKDFSQLMGQEHVVTVLVNALMQERLHHAYLFTGTRGVGKTTIARIFAKSLNCQEGITANPCGKCDVCLDVDEGRFVDLLEIDAASRTKVDDTREILDNVQYAPSRGRYKVYLIDEVHMLSKSSFNALLKTLEEPPPHVKFILATTDPQKLPITVLSRCLQFHLKALSVAQIETKLSEILTAEQVTVEDGALTILAKAARGSMRDSLSLTDQAIAQGKGHIDVANLQLMLGGVDQNWVYKILIALIKKDASGLLELTQSIATFAPSYQRLLAELLQLLHQVALWQLVPNSVDVDSQRATLLAKFANAMTPEDVQLYYQIVLNGRKDLPYSFDEQAGFDMVVLRLLAFKPATAAPVVTESSAQTLEAQTTNQFDEISLPKSTQPTIVSHAVEKTVKAADTTAVLSNASETVISAATADVEPQVKIDTELTTPAPETSTDALLSRAPAAQILEQRLDQAQVETPNIEQTAQSLDAEQQQLEQIAAQHSSPLASVQQSSTVEDTTQPQPVIEQTSVEASLQNSQEQQPQGQIEASATPIQNTEIAANPTAISAIPDVEKMIATRNMLRSRKKLSEGGAKKPQAKVNPKGSELPNQKPATQSPLAKFAATEDLTLDNAPIASTATITTESNTQPQVATPDAIASAQQPTSDTSSIQNVAVQSNHGNNSEAEPEPNQHQLPDVSHLEIGNFNPDGINPNFITNANQVDRWANTIDAMGLTGRVRQLALNAVMDPQSSPQHLLINLDSTFGHLNSAAALTQITDLYSQLQQQQTQVDVSIVSEPSYTPIAIQAIINQKRLDNATHIIENDDLIQHLQQRFAATIDSESIQAL